MKKPTITFNKLISTGVGLGTLLLVSTVNVTANEPDRTSQSDTAILVQAGHATPPNKVIAYNNVDNSFLETWDGIDVRLWRRGSTHEQWKILRHWKNLQGGWDHSPNDTRLYNSAYVDGYFELFNAENYSRLYHVDFNKDPGDVPGTYLISSDSNQATILTLPELDSEGRKSLSLHLGSPNSIFASWYPLEEQVRITRLSKLADSIFAVQIEGGNWQLIRITPEGDSSEIALPKLPKRVPKIRWLSDGLFGVAIYDTALRNNKDNGATWFLYNVTPQGEINAVHIPGLEPAAIKDIYNTSSRFLQLTERTTSEVDHSLQTHFYWLNSSNQPVPAHQVIPDLPAVTRNFRILANSTVVGAAEVDDANDNGTPGDWTWRMQDSQGQWLSPHDVLPELSGTIWNITDWLDGQGLGVKTMAGEYGTTYTSNWYLQNKKTGQWQSVENILPIKADIEIDTIQERRDGLIEITTQLDATIVPDINSPIPVTIQGTHWMMRTEDQEWSSVRDIVATHKPGLENLIIAVDARNNALMVDIQRNHDESPIRLLFYKNRDGQWTLLDNSFHAATSATSQTNNRPFTSVQHSEVMAEGKLVLLREQGDANWNGESNNIQLLQSSKQGWRVLQAQNALGGKSEKLHYDSDLGLLVRTSHAGDTSHFFHLGSDGSWTDVRSIIPGSPDELSSAFTFANNRGLAIKEQLDANGNGDFSEWFYHYRDKQGWQSLTSLLPDSYPVIQTIINAGGRSAISVQEAGDANGNEIANEWRHYYRSEDKWVDLQSAWSTLPDELSELHISSDGRILTAREDWDSNGNGQSFELIAGVWSNALQSFVPVSNFIDIPVANIIDIRSLWNGRGMAVKVNTTEQSTFVSSGTSITDSHSWHLYQHQANDSWQAFSVGESDLSDIHGDTTGRLLAVRTQASGEWEMWSRSSTDAPLSPWNEYRDTELKGVQLDSETGIFSIQLSDLWNDGDEQWELWRLNENGPTKLGRSGSPTWFGINHKKVRQGNINFDNAQHYLDGRRVENIPAPQIWFHANPAVPNQQNTVFAPQLIEQALATPGNSTLPVHIDAIGYGPAGSVIVYKNGTQRMVVGFSNGPSMVESRTLLINNKSSSEGELTLLVNRFPDGTEQLSRLDAPDRWIWSYNHPSGRIYYDDNGYFFNETDAVSEVLTFRVGTKVHTFEQLGSYLFRPDILENHLGVKEGSLFELTQRDVERIRLAKQLAPDGTNIANLLPPHIEVVASNNSVDQPYVDLNVQAEGLGISEASITVHILGAGQARSVVPSPKGGQRQKLKLTKRVPLVPGQNRLKVTVYDTNGLSHSQRLEVTYTPKISKKPTLYAVVVATAQYKGTNNLDDLPLTQNDARTITAALKEQSGKRFSKVITHTWCQEDDCLSKPVRKQMLEEIPRFLSRAKNGDYIIIYVSGHGLKIGSEYFMVPEDGDPALPSTLVAWSQIQEWLRGAKLGKKLVFLDTCQSGAVTQRKRDQRRMVQQAAEQDGIYVLSAAAADASAYELNSIGNGLFTYVVNEGITGQADAGADGIISFEDLSFYIARRVRELSSAQGVRMEPYVPILDQNMNFDIADVNRKIALFLRTSDISTFDNSALPMRKAWWNEKVKVKNKSITVNRKEIATHTLAIVEDNGNPIRSQLTAGNGNILGQWHFSKTTINNMLQEFTEVIAKNQKASITCTTGRGVTRNVACKP